MKKIFLMLMFISFFSVYSQKAYERFDISFMQYKGTKRDQVKFLMKKVLLGGKIDENPAEIDSEFLDLIDSELTISKEKLKNYLSGNDISYGMIGGNIDENVSSIITENGQKYCKYFVIHDISAPEYENEFPNNINDESWKYNKFSTWNWEPEKRPAHILLLRTGESKTLIDFSQGWRATKFESKILGVPSRGLFLHIELLQPRVFPPGKKGSAMKAPDPGLTQAQYKRLALLFVCASLRSGEWMIPAFHGDIDEGLEDAHDDPQNFEIKKFTDEVLNIVDELK